MGDLYNQNSFLPLATPDIETTRLGINVLREVLVPCMFFLLSYKVNGTHSHKHPSIIYKIIFWVW